MRVRLLVLFNELLLLTVLFFLVSCPTIKTNSDNPTSASQNVASDASDNPEIKYSMPKKLLKSMDFPAEYSIVELIDERDRARVVYVVKPPRTQEIAQLHLTDLQTRGYNCGDNPSRILEGVEFTGGEWRRIYIKVTEEYDKGTIVTIDVDF